MPCQAARGAGHAVRLVGRVAPVPITQHGLLVAAAWYIEGICMRKRERLQERREDRAKARRWANGDCSEDDSLPTGPEGKCIT